MLAHLTTLSKTFQTGKLNFSRINHAIERGLFNIKEVDDKQTPSKSFKKDLSSRLSLCEKDISITEEMEINRKSNWYAESLVENIAQRFPHASATVLNKFEIFNLELFPTSI